jgi:hypothetical protein
MKKISAAMLVLAAWSATPAAAGVYGDDATRCLVKSASEADQLALVKWLFAAIAQHPGIRDYATITAAQQEGFDRDMAAVVNRLLIRDCRKEAVAALRYEGTGFLGESFKAMGEVAMGGLMSNKAVEQGLSTWAGGLDEEALNVLGVEAGRSPRP